MFNNQQCSVIGCVHVLPLPGSASYTGDMKEIVRLAVNDAVLYEQNGIDALIIENMHDTPYLRGQVEPETTAAMTMVAQAVRNATQLPLGIQILAGANLEALGVAVAAGLDFIRVEGFVFAHVADEGLLQASAANLIRRRAQLQAERVKIFADIKKKHSAHAITGDVSLVETAHAAEFFKADGVIVTGTATGYAPDAAEVRAVSAATACSVLVGSGVTADNIDSFSPHCQGLIVGSSLKKDGKWFNHVDAARVKALTDRMNRQAMSRS